MQCKKVSSWILSENGCNVKYQNYSFQLAWLKICAFKSTLPGKMKSVKFSMDKFQFTKRSEVMSRVVGYMRLNYISWLHVWFLSINKSNYMFMVDDHSHRFHHLNKYWQDRGKEFGSKVMGHMRSHNTYWLHIWCLYIHPDSYKYMTDVHQHRYQGSSTD